MFYTGRSLVDDPEVPITPPIVALDGLQQVVFSKLSLFSGKMSLLAILLAFDLKSIELCIFRFRGAAWSLSDADVKMMSVLCFLHIPSVSSKPALLLSSLFFLSC